MVELPQPLAVTLREALPVLDRECHAPWWLIGSSALACWGMPGIVCRDVDVLVDGVDASRLETVWAARRDGQFRPDHDELFRSRFARYGGWPMALETMGDLVLCVDGEWRPVRPADRLRVETAAGPVCVPSLPALLEILDDFGRDKDRDKAARVRAWLAASPELPLAKPA